MTTPTIAAKQCATCQESFTSTHPHKIYCSEKCSAKAKRTRRNQNAQWVERERKRHREARLRKCHPAATTPSTKQCVSCHTPFELTNPNKLYCSKKCAYKAEWERRVQRGLIQSRTSPPRIKTCIRCNGSIVLIGRGGNNAKLCRYCNVKSPDYKLRSQARRLVTAGRYRRIKQSAQIYLDAQCVICDQWYKLSAKGIASRQRTCSTSCRDKQDHKRELTRKHGALRRARKKGRHYDKTITHGRVFERDAYKCRHCNKQVRTDVHITARNRAILGHINALAAGGTHTWDNVCTLCYPCNMKDGVNKIPIQYKIA